jgi:hypothetical protein
MTAEDAVLVSRQNPAIVVCSVLMAVPCPPVQAKRPVWSSDGSPLPAASRLKLDLVGQHDRTPLRARRLQVHE